MKRLVRLIEHRTREVRLPREDAVALLTHARQFIEVVPAFRRGVYRLTLRGFVGEFESPSCRFAVRPKFPWPNLAMLLGLSTEHAGEPPADPESELLNVLAREFAAQVRDVVRVGLVGGYHDHDTTSPFLRGRLRVPDQMRDAAARAFPDRFHLTETVFDLDTPWNRILRHTADSLLNRDLAEATRNQLQDASIPLASVPLASPSDADFVIAESEPRASHYRPLLAICKLLHDGFAAAMFPESSTGRGAFLVNLSQAFERYLTAGLQAELAVRHGWEVEPQPTFPVGPTVLQPDILLRRRGKPCVVLDAKWKAPGSAPDAADLHQILAYATVTGAKHVGLVYPGRRFARREYGVPRSDIRVSLIRVQVVGTIAECRRSFGRIARMLCRKRH